MAYAAAVTVNELSPQAGRRTFEIVVLETEAAAASEWNTAGTGSSTLTGSITAGNLPRVITIVSRKVSITSGTAATVAPIWARATGAVAAGAADYLDGFSAAAYIDDIERVPRRLTTGNIYGRSTVNAGSDNAIRTELIVVSGVM